jgi:hypothetical protein
VDVVVHRAPRSVRRQISVNIPLSSHVTPCSVVEYYQHAASGFRIEVFSDPPHGRLLSDDVKFNYSKFL